MAAPVDSETLIAAIHAASEKHGVEYVSLWATSISALVSAAALLVIFRQMRAGDKQLDLLASQIQAMVKPAATALEQQTREFAVRMMWEWVTRVQFESRQVALLVHKLDFEQCKSLDALHDFTIGKEHQGRVQQCFPPGYLLKTDDQGRIIISGDALNRLRFATIGYLNIIETILIAWDRNLADRRIIEEQFSFLIADGANALETYRGVPSVKGSYPSIERFVHALRQKSLPSPPSPSTKPDWSVLDRVTPSSCLPGTGHRGHLGRTPV